MFASLLLVHLSVCKFWAVMCFNSSWGSQSKNTEVICYFLLQWTTFCQNSPPWPVHLDCPYIAWLMKVKESEVAQSCPTLWDPMNCSLSGSSLHGILQARILEWVAISFSRGSSPPRDQTQVSRIAGKHFNLWATREVHSSIGLNKALVHVIRLVSFLWLWSSFFSALWWKKIKRLMEPSWWERLTEEETGCDGWVHAK